MNNISSDQRLNAFKIFGVIAGLSAVVACTSICAAQELSLPSLQPETPELFPANWNGEKTVALANLWDGVDNTNDLHVLVSSYWVLNDAGQMVLTRFPPSPNFVDINNDGLKDLVVGDSYGFLWIYLNSGEKGKPKFTTGTFIHTFTGWASRTHMTDWDQDGDYDAIVGTFYGNIVFMENMGTRRHYKFIKKMGIPRYGADNPETRFPSIMMEKSSMILGIYIAPWVTDWNNDHKPDLIAGEGTYSANSVRLALNKGARGKPAFVKDGIFFLAYGEGFEQLTPCVVDYNGDGIDDLIVGTRTGHIRLHKGTGKAVEGTDMVAAIRSSLAPAILEFDGFLKIADKPVFDTMSIVYPCDWNEDGLFDLLMGSTSGKIYLTLNQGTKNEPKFPKVQTIKGTNTEKDLLAPSGWEASIKDVCNAALLLSAEKQVVLQPGTQPIKPVDGEWFMYFRYVPSVTTDDQAGEGFFRPKKNYIGWVQQKNTRNVISGGRTITMSGHPIRMLIGKRYQFTFDSILKGKKAMWTMNSYPPELIKPGTDTTPPVYEYRSISDTVHPSSSWQKRVYTFECPGLHKTKPLTFNLSFTLPEDDCVFMLDNFSLKEIKR